MRALSLGERLDARTEAARMTTARPSVDQSEEGTAMLFRYGAAVLFGFRPESEVSFLKSISARVSEPHLEPEVEDVDIVLEPDQVEGVDRGAIVLREPSLERFEVVAEILGKSVALAQEERAVGHVFDRIEPLAADLQRRGRVGRQARDLLRHIGNALLVQHKTVARVEVAEKPELLWDHPDLERLYLRLEDEYELRERHLALERKLRLISETAETLLELLQTRRALRVEWYIVILIVVEILLTLYEMVVKF